MGSLSMTWFALGCNELAASGTGEAAAHVSGRVQPVIP